MTVPPQGPRDCIVNSVSLHVYEIPVPSQEEGGKIAAKNVEGGAARFYFTLPVSSEN